MPDRTNGKNFRRKFLGKVNYKDVIYFSEILEKRKLQDVISFSDFHENIPMLAFIMLANKMLAVEMLALQC